MPPASCEVRGGVGGGTAAAAASGAAGAGGGGPAAAGGGRGGAATLAGGGGAAIGGGGSGGPLFSLAMPSPRQRLQGSAATHCEARTTIDAAEGAVRSADVIKKRQQTAIEEEARTAEGGAGVSSFLKKDDELMWGEECVGEDGSQEEQLRKRRSGRVREEESALLPSNFQQQQKQQEEKETLLQEQKEKDDDQQKKAHADDDERQKGGLPEPPTKPRFCSYSSDNGPVAAGTIVIRPFLRGKIHLTLFCLSPVWIFLLLSACSSTRSIIAAAISSLSFVFNFFASALLHCFEWADRPALKQLLHKLDHAGIFFVISGSTTPIPVLLLDASSSFWLLLVQFVATCYGFVSIIFGDLSSGARKRRAYTYIIVGLLHALFLSEYYRVLTRNELLAISTLSTLYVLGALVYGFKWPDPFPAVYGFHEVFHSFCLVSFIVTVWLDYVVIRRAEWAAMPIGSDAAKTESLPPSQGEMPGMFGEA